MSRLEGAVASMWLVLIAVTVLITGVPGLYRGQLGRVREVATVNRALVARNQRTAGRLGAVVRQIQVERSRNTFNACERDNLQNKAIVGFVMGARHITSEAVARARVAFPQKDCAAFTERRVRGSKP